MKKIICLSLLAIMLCSETPAQPKTVDEIKAYLCQYKWMLRRLEHEGKYYKVQAEDVGTKWVFLNTGKCYQYTPSEVEANAETFSWTLTATKIHITNQKGEKTTYNYRFEDFIGYKLYTTDTEGSDNPTFVWEQSDKIGSKPVQPVSNISGGSTKPATTSVSTPSGGTAKVPVKPALNVPPASTRDQWIFLCTKGKPLIAQTWLKANEFPYQEIEDKWKEGYYVTEITEGDSEKKYFITLAKTNYANQTWQKRSTLTGLIEAIQEMKKNNSSYKLTNISFANKEWIMVASEGTIYTDQVYKRSTEYPSDTVDAYWKKGYDITDLTYGDGGWLLVMSKGLNLKDQRIRSYDKWDYTPAYEARRDGFTLTHVNKANGRWYAVYDKDVSITETAYEVYDKSPPGAAMTSFRNQGYFFYRTIRIPGAN